MVVGLGNCQKVIEAGKAMRQLLGFHHLDILGLVDRDHRSNDEITALRGQGLRVADVEEENLFCIPAALAAAAVQLKCDDASAKVEAAKQRVLTELEKCLDAQIAARAIAEIQFRLSGFGPKAGSANAAMIQAEVAKHVSMIDVSTTFLKSHDLFKDIVARADYDAALRHYNCKGMTSFVSAELGLKAQAYYTMIIGIVRSDPSGALANGMRKMIS